MTAAQFLERLLGELGALVGNEDQLRRIWSNPDTREHFLVQLGERGYDRERFDSIRDLVDAPRSDLFDVLSFVLYATTPKTRHERAEHLRQDTLTREPDELRSLLQAILRAYEAHGESELATKKLGQVLTARYGSVGESRTKLGDVASVKAAYLRMQAQLYAR